MFLVKALMRDEARQLCRAVGGRAEVQVTLQWVGGRAGPASGLLGLSVPPRPCLQQTVLPGKTALPVLLTLPPRTDPRYFLQVQTCIGIRFSSIAETLHIQSFIACKKLACFCSVNQNAMFADKRWTDAVEVCRSLSLSEVK